MLQRGSHTNNQKTACQPAQPGDSWVCKWPELDPSAHLLGSVVHEGPESNRCTCMMQVQIWNIKVMVAKSNAVLPLLMHSAACPPFCNSMTVRMTCQPCLYALDSAVRASQQLHHIEAACHVHGCISSMCLHVLTQFRTVCGAAFLSVATSSHLQLQACKVPLPESHLPSCRAQHLRQAGHTMGLVMWLHSK